MYKINTKTLSRGKDYKEKANFEYGNELVDVPSYFEADKDKLNEKNKRNRFFKKKIK